jgi:hypothetical protein
MAHQKTKTLKDLRLKTMGQKKTCCGGAKVGQSHLWGKNSNFENIGVFRVADSQYLALPVQPQKLLNMPARLSCQLAYKDDIHCDSSTTLSYWLYAKEPTMAHGQKTINQSHHPSLRYKRKRDGLVSAKPNHRVLLISRARGVRLICRFLR